SIVASVTTNNGLYEDLLNIYDSGVARANSIPMSTIGSLPAIFVNPSKPEVYATSNQSGYQVLSYDSTGLTHLAGNSGTNNFSANYGTAVQVDNGNAYLDTGVVLGAETGTLEGTFYVSGATVATGPMVSDSTLGKNFVLYTSSYGSGSTPYTIDAFDESTYTLDASDSIPVNGPLSGIKYGSGSSSETELNGYNNVDTLVRWGSNGLAFRAANGVFSLRSNGVRDLSTTSADLGVSISAPASTAAGSNYSAVATLANHGPSTATNAVVSATIPSGTTVVSASTSAGSCFVASAISCSIGNIANGDTVTVTIDLTANSEGNALLSATVSAGENDPVTSNNAAESTTAITGTSFAPTPTLASLSPNAAQVGTSDFTLTVNGTGFDQDSAIAWGTTQLSTSFVSATELTANVPGSLLTTINWAPVTVVTPTPGGGTSNALPFSIYATVSLQANHILYDPFTRLLYASVNSSSAQVAGNSLVTVDPGTGTLGSPISVGSQPDKMALTDDGNFLYVNLDGANSVGRFNMSTQHLDFSFPVGTGSFFTPALRDIAALPGSETTVAVDLGENAGLAVYDVDPTSQTGTARTASGGNGATGPYTGSSLQFLNASTLFSFDVDTSGATFNAWTVTPTGLSGGYTSEFTLNNFSAFKIRNGVAYANAGGVADAAVTPPTQLGVFLPPAANTGTQSVYNYYNYFGQITEPDTSLGLSFFAQAGTSSGSGSEEGLTISAFDQQRYSQVESMSTLFPTSGSLVPLIDMLRCGQDGLAILRSDGVIMLFRGGFIVPGLLQQNPAASLSSSSSLAHGSGNSVMTLTGTGFLPGVAVMWNGSYRTTTLVNSTEVTVDLPASDLASAGTASVTAVNPGAAASNGLTVTIN
ncbi:MAG: transcription factor, partial [Acidobacteriaceae bacterium]